jgi:hypothetical protein
MDGPTYCAVCLEVQMETDHGVVCANGHGGAPSLTHQDALKEEKRRFAALPGDTIPHSTLPWAEMIHSADFRSGIEAGEALVGRLIGLGCFPERKRFALAVIDRYIQTSDEDDKAWLKRLKALVESVDV